MIDNESRAHDLAILYMQLEFKEDKIAIPYEEDIPGFFNEYERLRQQFTCLLEER